MNQQMAVQSSQNQHNQQVQSSQANQQNQSPEFTEPMEALMTKVKHIEGSMRRQSGDICEIKKLLENQQLNVQSAESDQQLTRQEFTKAINYMVGEITKQAKSSQQVLTNELKEIKQQLESVTASSVVKTSNAKANLNQHLVQSKLMGFSTGDSVKLTVPLIGNVQLPLPVPIKFIKPIAIGGLVLFALIIMFLGSN